MSGDKKTQDEVAKFLADLDALTASKRPTRPSPSKAPSATASKASAFIDDLLAAPPQRKVPTVPTPPPVTAPFANAPPTATGVPGYGAVKQLPVAAVNPVVNTPPPITTPQVTAVPPATPMTSMTPPPPLSTATSTGNNLPPPPMGNARGIVKPVVNQALPSVGSIASQQKGQNVHHQHHHHPAMAHVPPSQFHVPSPTGIAPGVVAGVPSYQGVSHGVPFMPQQTANQELYSGPAYVPMDQPPQSSNETPTGSAQTAKAGNDGSFNWKSLWSSTTTSFTKGLETASKLAGETAKAVSTNESVKNLNIGKLGDGLSKLAMQLGDTIAPPISATRDPSDDSFFATKIILWLCVEADSEEPGKALADFVQITANDIWLDPRNRMAHCVKVHHVQHPGPVVGTSIPQALKQTEASVERLQKLSDETQAQSSPIQIGNLQPTGEADSVVSVLLVVQQVNLPVQSLLLDDPVHLMYHVTMIADAPNLGLVCCSALSQSVDQPLGIVPTSSVWAQWEKTQRGRVLETVVGDLMEEFVAKVGLARSQGPS